MIERKSARDYLVESAIQLCTSYPIEKVSVKMIAENCGYSTRTFYKYYKDKYDIIASSFDNEIKRFFREAEPCIGIYDYLLFAARIVHDQESFFSHVFYYTGQNNIKMELERPIRDQYLRIIRDYFHAEITDNILHATTFFIKGQLSYIEEVLYRTQLPTPEESVDYFINAMPAILLPYLYYKAPSDKDPVKG